MLRSLTSAVIGAVVLCGAVSPSDSAPVKRPDGSCKWWAPDSAWVVAIGEVRGPEKLVRLWEGRPEKFEGLLMFELMGREKGDWFWLWVKLPKVDKVTFTRNTRVVVIDKDGRRVESEAIFFWPDFAQTSLYDSRKSPVVVSETSVWRGLDDVSPSGCVKFPAGSAEVGEIVDLEVVGAIEQRGDGRSK